MRRRRHSSWMFTVGSDLSTCCCLRLFILKEMLPYLHLQSLSCSCCSNKNAFSSSTSPECSPDRSGGEILPPHVLCGRRRWNCRFINEKMLHRNNMLAIKISAEINCDPVCVCVLSLRLCVRRMQNQGQLPRSLSTRNTIRWGPCSPLPAGSLQLPLSHWGPSSSTLSGSCQTLVGMSNLNLPSCQLISLEISLQFFTKEAAFSVCAAGDSTAVTPCLIHLVMTHICSFVFLLIPILLIINNDNNTDNCHS